MKEEFLLEATDNGMIVRSANGIDVIENTHTDNVRARENIYSRLGFIFHEVIMVGMEELKESQVRMKIEITKA